MLTCGLGWVGPLHPRHTVPGSFFPIAQADYFPHFQLGLDSGEHDTAAADVERLHGLVKGAIVGRHAQNTDLQYEVGPSLATPSHSSVLPGVRFCRTAPVL